MFSIGYFLLIGQTGSLSLAGKRLGLTQSSLSISIKRLEAELGQRLLDRGRTGIRLTEKGAQFLEFIRKRERVLDFAFVNWENIPPGPLISREMASTAAAVMASRHHFPQIAKVKSWDELSNFPWVALTREPEPAWASVLDFAERGYVIQELATLRSLILSGDAITDVPILYFTHAEQKKLIIRRDISQAPHAKIYLVWRPDASERLQHLLRRLK